MDCSGCEEERNTNGINVMMKWIIAIGILLIGLSFGQLIVPSIMADFAGIYQGGLVPPGWVLIETVLVWILAGSIATVMYKLFSR